MDQPIANEAHVVIPDESAMSRAVAEMLRKRHHAALKSVERPSFSINSQVRHIGSH